MHISLNLPGITEGLIRTSNDFQGKTRRVVCTVVQHASAEIFPIHVGGQVVDQCPPVPVKREIESLLLVLPIPMAEKLEIRGLWVG